MRSGYFCSVRQRPERDQLQPAGIFFDHAGGEFDGVLPAGREGRILFHVLAEPASAVDIGRGARGAAEGLCAARQHGDVRAAVQLRAQKGIIDRHVQTDVAAQAHDAANLKRGVAQEHRQGDEIVDPGVGKNQKRSSFHEKCTSILLSFYTILPFLQAMGCFFR